MLRFHPYEPHLAVADRGGVRYVCQFTIGTMFSPRQERYRLRN